MTFPDRFSGRYRRRGQSPCASVAGRRVAHDFLSLPAVGSDLLLRAVLRWSAEKEVAGVIAAQFDAGVLKSRDVPEFKGAGDALAHAFFAWARRRTARMRCLNFQLPVPATSRITVTRLPEGED